VAPEELIGTSVLRNGEVTGKRTLRMRRMRDGRRMSIHKPIVLHGDHLPTLQGVGEALLPHLVVKLGQAGVKKLEYLGHVRMHPHRCKFTHRNLAVPLGTSAQVLKVLPCGRHGERRLQLMDSRPHLPTPNKATLLIVLRLQMRQDGSLVNRK